MGIFSSVLKYVSWGKIATLAMEYGPELVRQVRGRFKSEDVASAIAPAPELNERISRLEKLLLEQEQIIIEQKKRNSMLEENYRTLESQFGLLKVVTAISLGISLVMLVLLIMRW